MNDLEKKLKEFEHNLKERVKELGCLYEISRIAELPNISINDLLKETLKTIPPALQFPEIAHARIIYDGAEFKTDNFKATKWNLSSQIKINSSTLTLEVYYLENKKFLREEKHLMDDIAVRLKSIIEHREYKEEISIRDKITKVFREFTDDRVYNEVLNIVQEVVESEMGYFGFINEEGDLVTPSLTREIYWEKCDVPDKNIIFLRKDWGGIWGKSLLDKTTIISKGPFNFPKGHIVLSNVMSVPILYQDNAIGHITVGNKATDYNNRDKRFLENIANKISPILQARLERDQKEKERQRIARELKESIREREKIQEDLDDIDKQILRELNEDGKKGLQKFEVAMSKVMSHTGIKNRIKKLTDSDILKIQGNVNIKKLNYRLAFLLLELRRSEDLKKFIDYYTKCKRVFFVLSVSGKYHLLLGIIAKSFEIINNFVSYCGLINDEDVAKSELIFGSNLEFPLYLPINLFGNKNKDFNCERICKDCDYFKQGLCEDCEKN